MTDSLPLTKAQAVRALKIAAESGLYGFGGGCAAVALAINEVLFCGQGKIVAALNQFLWHDSEMFVGHVTVRFKGHFWDAEGIKLWVNVESWGMVNPNDPDYDFPFEEAAYETMKREFNEDGLREAGFSVARTRFRTILKKARNKVLAV